MVHRLLKEAQVVRHDPCARLGDPENFVLFSLLFLAQLSTVAPTGSLHCRLWQVMLFSNSIIRPANIT
jgi:hypothetical protein